MNPHIDLMDPLMDSIYGFDGFPYRTLCHWTPKEPIKRLRIPKEHPNTLRGSNRIDRGPSRTPKNPRWPKESLWHCTPLDPTRCSRTLGDLKGTPKGFCRNLWSRASFSNSPSPGISLGATWFVWREERCHSAPFFMIFIMF